MMMFTTTIRIQITVFLLIITISIVNCHGARYKLYSKDVNNATSNRIMGQKDEKRGMQSGNMQNTNIKTEFGQLWTGQGAEFAGIKVSGSAIKSVYASISIFSPNVDITSEYSSASVFVESGNDATYNSINVGWMVNPGFFGDNQVRFFLYSVGKNTQACANQQCTNFVVVDGGGLKLGDALTPSKVGFNPQQLLNVYIAQDGESKWYVEANSKSIGYFKVEQFDSLANGATTIHIGGQVFTPSWTDSSPPMGSGSFVNGWKARTCYAEGIKINDNPPQNPETIETRCYFVGDVGEPEKFQGFGFFFGGKGGTDEGKCIYDSERVS